LIADASGKGIEAARLSAFTQYAIRTLTGQFSDPAQVLMRFNRLFLDTFADPSSFVVVFLGAFDAPSGTLRYASAGHGSAFIVRPRGVEQLAPTGAIIGLTRDEAYAVHTIGLVAGETLVLATDGLTESRDASGEMLGDDGVVALLRDSLAEPQTICDELASEVLRRSRGEVADDLAILVLRILDADAAPVTATFSTLSA
jgi:serine phosphatase RsbU (regulator of sigma subunit)